jgi:predicted phage tail protein
VAAETTYYYRLQAVNNVGSSAFSNTSIATTPVSAVPVAPSMLVAVSRARDQISLSWRDNSSIEIRFLIERSRSADFATIDGTRTTSANETSFWDWGLSAGTTYYYRVRAESAAFVSPWSNVASATTSGTAPSGLNPPSALQGQSRGRTQISLSWEDNSALETGFRIERSTTADFSADVFLRAAPANATLFWDWGLSAGTTYYYRVSAISATSVSTPSNVVSIRTDGTTTPLGAPSGIVATPLESGEITLAWQDNAGSETRFRIERSRSATFASGIVVREAPANSELFWDWDLLPGTRYYYRIRAENAGGVGDWSATVNALTAGDLNVPPAAPTGLTVRQQAADVILNWIDNANNENGFLIQRSTTSDFSSGVVTRQSGASGGVFWDWGLVSGTTYFYRVRAFNDAGNSAFSNVVTINYTV